MLNNGIRRSVEDTKKTIAKMLDGDDDNIALSQLKISLMDPVSLMKHYLLRSYYVFSLACKN